MTAPTLAQFNRSAQAPTARTLMDILTETSSAHPDAPAIDDGDVVLTYSELMELVDEGAVWLGSRGIGLGDRVGIRMPSGSRELYLAILSTLAAGAAYVPVDADDPPERATSCSGRRRWQRSSAPKACTWPSDLGLTRSDTDGDAVRPDIDDDAWIIFTSGSTGTPKGVAVTHRNAAAFVDAEAQMFLQDEPLGPG